jgi:hypothetical protein
MVHECIQEENIGMLKEFMLSTKGMKATLFVMAITIVTQVVTFAFLWGDLTRTVSNNTNYLRNYATVT